MPYIRKVKTTSGATAVQVVWSSRRGSREIEHLGSAHDEAELEALKATAQQRMAAGQLELGLGLGGRGPSGPLPITASRMSHLVDALERGYRVLGFEDAAGGDGRTVRIRAGRRIVGIPEMIVPTLREHLAAFADDDPGALVFPGVKGGPLRRGNFNKMSAWPHAVETLGLPGLHLHDLRHTGNHFASTSGAALRDLMARMGHDSKRAAMIYQHEAQGADKAITNAIDTHVQAEQAKRDDGPADVMAPAG